MEQIIDKIKELVSIEETSCCDSMSNIQEMVKNIKRLHVKERLIPVICEDMYEYKNPDTQERQSLHSFIVERVLRKLKKKGIKIAVTERDVIDIINNVHYGMSLLKAKAGVDIYEEIFDAVVNEDYRLQQGVCLKKEVRDFLKVCKFPLIITTNSFPIIENEMDDGYESYWSELETQNTIPLPSKCVYHLFGEAKPDNSNWGYNEKQLLRFLCSAYSTDYALKNLTCKIGNKSSRKTLIILGNNSPDWLFRFILTPIYGGDVYDDGKGFYMSEKKCEDNTLSQFLHDIKFEKDSQLVTVLNEVTSKISESHSQNSCSHNKKYDFFIAHANKDQVYAEKLVMRLRDNGLNVWVDYENIKDGQYWQRIIDALQDSAYFMPFVTESYIQKNRKKNEVLEILREEDCANLSMTMSECMRLEKRLEGVQIELLMAKKWYDMNEKEVYSIPVILKGSCVLYDPITPARIRNWSEESRLLPQKLFWGIQMYEFDKDNPESFELEWDRYKSTNRS